LALDTKYRPLNYSDVLGQESTVEILKRIVVEGHGFHQSYVFCGLHGGGKTTLGRILSRALLCESPISGEPCNECTSCVAILERGNNECFIELDAATKSGKADITKITEDVTYSTFSGKRRVYLFDEAHQLSKQALDAMLKPMEDNVHGSEDKQLICIFCTTEPSKMRSTIFSRCAPAFVIKSVPPDLIAKRLAYVCDSEGISYDLHALEVIATITDCHIRDALKTVEGVSMLGAVNMDNVTKYLRLDSNYLALELLESFSDPEPKRAIEIASRISSEMSPTSAYERVSEAALYAYHLGIGVGGVPIYWDSKRLMHVYNNLGTKLLNIASTFSNPPRRPGHATLSVDVAMLYANRGVHTTNLVASVVLNPSPSGRIPNEGAPPPRSTVPSSDVDYSAYGIHVDNRAVRRSQSTPPTKVSDDTSSSALFRAVLAHELSELTHGKGH
jgi:DNA polymerase III subunit gamma/tau